MKAMHDQTASLVPFQVSASKRSVPLVLQTTIKPYLQQIDRPYSKFTIRPILRSLLPDKNFEWASLLRDSEPVIEEDNTPLTEMSQRETVILPITRKMISALGLAVLPNRRVCVAGKMLAGIYMPKDQATQAILLRGFLAWYLPCIQIRMSTLTVNEKCFAKQQRKFLKTYLYSLWANRYMVYPG